MWLNLFKLIYSQDLAGQRAFMTLVQGTPFGLAGLGNSLCLVYQTQLNLLIAFVAISYAFFIPSLSLPWVSSGLVGLTFPLVGSVTMPGWMPLLGLSWSLAACGCNSWLALPASRASYIISLAKREPESTLSQAQMLDFFHF